MDAIATIKNPLISDIYQPSELLLVLPLLCGRTRTRLALKAFIPLLEANRSQIEAVKRATFKYGETTRHKVHFGSLDAVESIDARPIPA